MQRDPKIHYVDIEPLASQEEEAYEKGEVVTRTDRSDPSHEFHICQDDSRSPDGFFVERKPKEGN